MFAVGMRGGARWNVAVPYGATRGFLCANSVTLFLVWARWERRAEIGIQRLVARKGEASKEEEREKGLRSPARRGSRRQRWETGSEIPGRGKCGRHAKERTRLSRGPGRPTDKLR